MCRVQLLCTGLGQEFDPAVRLRERAEVCETAGQVLVHRGRARFRHSRDHRRSHSQVRMVSGKEML
jgi:hypothetical protein